MACTAAFPLKGHCRCHQAGESAPVLSSSNSNKSRNVISEVSLAMKYRKKVIPVRLDLSPYAESIEYDIINHDYVDYDSNKEDIIQDLLKKTIATLKMQE